MAVRRFARLRSYTAFLPCERPPMPRPKVAAPDTESRKALEQRAREAAMPAPPREKGRWPFPVPDDQPAGKTEGRHEEPEKPAKPGKSGD